MLKWIEIDRSIIRNNIKVIRNNISKNVQLMAVVKADGYGHGAVEISKIAETEKVDMLGVINCDEAKILRENSIKLPLMILSPSVEEEIPLIFKYNIIPTVDKIDFLKKLSAYSKTKIKINIDVDTGLKRWGVDIGNLREFINKAKKMKNIEIFSLSTHIAYTPYKNMVDAKEKLERFKEIASEIKKEINSIKIHALNSLAFLDFPEYHFDMVRIGNLIYGIYPRDRYEKKDNSPIKLGIKRPWRFFAKIISVKEVKKGESFGYASEIVATSDMKIASIQVGYCDGLGMIPYENTYTITEGPIMWGMIKGKRAYFVSKPAISHTLLDVTAIDVKPQDIVELPIRRTAASKSIPRVYIN